MGERPRRLKVRKLMGCNDISSIWKAKAAHASKANEEILSTAPISSLLFSFPQENRASSPRKDTCDHSEHPSLFLSSPSFIRWVWCQRLCNVLLVSWGQFSWLCPLRTTCAFTASSLVGWGEQKKISWCCISTGLQQQKHPCVTNPDLITNSKCSLIPATENKNNSIQVKTSSVNKCLFWKLLGV